MLSIFIQTLNEEKNLPGCLDSVSWSDDIHVLDSISTDGTEKICLDRGIHFYQRKYDGRGPNQNWAVENIPFKHKWVFYLDADERMTPELRAEIEAIADDPNERRVAYFCGRHNYFMGKYCKYSMRTTFPLRLFQPPKVRWARLANPVPTIDGESGFLKARYDHYNFNKGFNEWFNRHNKYSDYEAMETIKALQQPPVPLRKIFFGNAFDRRVALKNWSFRMPMRPLLKFIYMYFLQFGLLDGGPGFHYCMLQAFYEYQIVLKVKEARLRDKGITL